MQTSSLESLHEFADRIEKRIAQIHELSNPEEEQFFIYYPKGDLFCTSALTHLRTRNAAYAGRFSRESAKEILDSVETFITEAIAIRKDANPAIAPTIHTEL